jgi:hypothetical protein
MYQAPSQRPSALSRTFSGGSVGHGPAPGSPQNVLGIVATTTTRREMVYQASARSTGRSMRTGAGAAIDSGDSGARRSGACPDVCGFSVVDMRCL